MKSRRVKLGGRVFAVLASAAWLVPALGQQKPDRPPYVPPPPPPAPLPPPPPPPVPGRLANLNDFAAAYERARGPMFAVAFSSEILSKAKSTLIENKLRGVFLNPRVKLVAEKGVLLNAKAAELAAATSAFGRARLVATKTSAELVLVADLIQGDGGESRLNYTLFNLRNNLELGSGQVSSSGKVTETSDRDLEDLAYRAAERAASDFIEQFPADGAAQTLPMPAEDPPLVVENITDLVAAYRRAQSPRLLVATRYLGTSDKDEARQLTNRSIHNIVDSRVRDALQDAQIVQVIVAGRNLEVHTDADEFNAAVGIGRETRAGIVLLSTLSESGNDGRAYVLSYKLIDMRVMAELGANSWILDANDEGRFTEHQLKWAGYTLALDVSNRFARAFPEAMVHTGRAFTIRLGGGFDDEDVLSFQDALKSIKGIDPQSVRGEHIRDGDIGLLTYDLRFSGDVLTLRHAIRRAAINNLGMEADVRLATEGRLDVSLRVRQPIDREQFLAGGNIEKDFRESDKQVGARKERELLDRLYEQAGRPRVAVMINRAVGRDELDEALPPKMDDDRAKLEDRLRKLEEAAKSEVHGQAKPPEPKAPAQPQSEPAPEAVRESAGVTVVVRPQIVLGGTLNERAPIAPTVPVNQADKAEPNPGLAAFTAKAKPNQANPEEVLDTTMMENRVVQRFIAMKIEMVDLAQAESKLRQECEFQQQYFGESELALLMGRSAKAQIIVSGVGRIIRSADQLPRTVRYTFRAFRVNDSRILGTATVEREFAWATGAQGMEQLAGEAVGKLLSQMVDSWTPPQSLEVTVSNASVRRVQEIMDLIEQRFSHDASGQRMVRSVRQLSYDAGREGGFATVRIDVETDPNKLRAELTRASDLPFTLESYSHNDQVINLRVTQ